MPYIHEESAKTLVHAFVSSRLDYCNSLLYGVSDELLQKLQVIQNAAAVTSAVHSTAPAALYRWCRQLVRVTTTATERRRNRTNVVRLNGITTQSVPVEENCCHRLRHSAAGGVSPQPWSPPRQQVEYADPCGQGDADMLFPAETSASDSSSARSWRHCQRRGSAGADTTELRQRSDRRSAVLDHCTTGARHQHSYQAGVWSSAEGPRHWRHHQAALATDLCPDTVQAVPARTPGTDRSVTELRRRAATACYRKTPKSAVSQQQRLARPTNITEVWLAAVQCCRSCSL